MIGRSFYTGIFVCLTTVVHTCVSQHIFRSDNVFGSVQRGSFLPRSVGHTTIDSNGLCVEVKTASGGASGSSCNVDVKIRLAESDVFYSLTLSRHGSKGKTSKFCTAKNTKVITDRIEQVIVHHTHGCNDGWQVAAGGFKVMLNGLTTTWYLPDYAYNSRSTWWTDGDGDADGRTGCLWAHWCELRSHEVHFLTEH